MTEYRDFPVDKDGKDIRKIAVSKDGKPKTKSRAYMNMVADICAMSPEDRSPAANSLIRRLSSMTL